MKKSDKCEIRIGVSEFGKVPSVDVREFVAYHTDGEMGPTKKGFLVPEESWDEFVAMVNSFKLTGAGKKAPRSSPKDKEIKSGYLFVVTRSKSESHITKKATGILDDGGSALQAKPVIPELVPADGYYLVKCKVAEGSVVSFKRVAKSFNGAWVPY